MCVCVCGWAHSIGSLLVGVLSIASDQGPEYKCGNNLLCFGPLKLNVDSTDDQFWQRIIVRACEFVLD